MEVLNQRDCGNFIFGGNDTQNRMHFFLLKLTWVGSEVKVAFFPNILFHRYIGVTSNQYADVNSRSV